MNNICPILFDIFILISALYLFILVTAASMPKRQPEIYSCIVFWVLCSFWSNCGTELQFKIIDDIGRGKLRMLGCDGTVHTTASRVHGVLNRWSFLGYWEQPFWQKALAAAE